MDSICRTSFNPNPNLSLPILSSSRPPSFFCPQLSLPRKPSPFKTLSLTPVRASRVPHPSPSPSPSRAQTLISAVVKPAFIALTAAAAVFLSRHPKPSLATAIAPPPITTRVETLADELNEQTLESRLESDPSDIAALRSLMELKVKAHKLPEAIAIVDRLIALEPSETDLPLLKAHLQSYSGEIEAAKLGFEEILSKNPYLVEAYHGLVVLASQSGADAELDGILKRVDSAMAMCKKEKRKEELRDFKLLVAQVRVIEGNYAEALEIYQELVKEEPRDFRPYLCQGIIYTLMRKKDEAEKQFEKYRKLVPKGHPYAQFFDHNMNMMKGFSPVS